MSKLSRREMLGASVLGAAGALALPGMAQTTTGSAPVQRKGNIKQSVARWCYQKMALDDLCQNAAQMGLKAIDLLGPEEWDVPRKYGLICAMGYPGKPDIYKGLNKLENQAQILQDLETYIPLAAKAGVPNLICFSGARHGMPADRGAENCISGLNKVKKMAEDHGVNVVMELLNSKIDHPDYMCDNVAWGVSVMRGVDSPRVKLLYDIYHMQIMEGDLIRTITTNINYIAHFHTGGVPRRHELNGDQEVRWDGVMRGIVAAGYQGYVAHEFIPTGDPMTSLRQAVDLCDV